MYNLYIYNIHPNMTCMSLFIINLCLQERLLLSVLPQHIAMEMKQQVLTPNKGLVNDAHVQTFDNVR